MTTGHTLHIERPFQAPAKAVFDAWTSEEVMRRWWHAEHHWETTEAIVDLRVGGAVRVVMRNPDDGTEYGGGGEYTEIDPTPSSTSPTAVCGMRRPSIRTRTVGRMPSTTWSARSVRPSRSSLLG